MKNKIKARKPYHLLRLLGAMALLAGGSARAQTKPAEDWVPPDAKKPATTAPATQTGPTVKASLTEWVIFVAAPHQGQLNRLESIENHLPDFIEDRRGRPADSANAATTAMPIGLIRLQPLDPPDKDDHFDISLNYTAGRAMGTWPPANVRSSGILWQDLAWQSADGTTTPPKPLPDHDWLAPLRTADQPLYLKSVAEPFVLYDVELNYRAFLEITSGEKNTYNLVQPMDATMHDLTLYQRAANGHWQTAALATLAKTPGSSMAALEKPAPPPPTPPGQNGVVIINGVVQGPPAKPAATAPAIAPATQPHGTSVVMTETPATDESVLASWHTPLTNAGVSATDQTVILKILAKYALDPNRLTAIYRMDPAELEKIMPLEVVPQPEKISRIALVVVTEIDPKIQQELDVLITKLGSPTWADREAAAAEIKKMGPTARPRLEAATHNGDMEIVYRAEKLLDDMPN